ncbi:MAG: nucleotidyltransferase domain-containing protein [Candidatus Woesearchaeota archaeon]
MSERGDKLRRIKSVLAEVISEITPDRLEHRFAMANAEAFIEALNRELKRRKTKARAVLGGSFAKGSWLKGDYDIDIFVKFKQGYSDAEMSQLLGLALKQLARPFKVAIERVHGSRDYFKAKGKVNFEIVPVLDIRTPAEAKNVTDFSPWHVRWVKRYGKNLKADILLTKQFLKANGVYGAESYIKGFSGHVVDILVIHYKGFLGLLKAAASWPTTPDNKVVIDHDRVYKGKALFMMNKSKIQGPLIVVDPVQPQRNAAASLSFENYLKFVYAAREFLQRPSKDFFVPKMPDFASLAKKGTVLMLEVEPVEGISEVVGTKLLKAFEFVKKGLEDFGIVEAGWNWDAKADKNKKHALFWFVLKQKILPEKMAVKGPPASREPYATTFKKAHRKVFERNGWLWAEVKRPFTKPVEAVHGILKNEWLRGKIKKARLLRNKIN